MSLPAPNLDDRRFQQFVDDAKRYVQERCPEWTDHNVSDPGVTLIETFAFMLDQLVYRLNRIPDRHYVAFLNLLDVALFPAAAAQSPVTFWLSAIQPQTVVLPAGTEVATQRTATDPAVVFTTAADLDIVPCGFRTLLLIPAEGAAHDATSDLLAGQDVRCFSARPRPGDAMLVGLSAAVGSCAVVIGIDSRVDGVGVDPRQPPLVWEAHTVDGWQECEVEQDETGGLNQAGDVVLHVPGGHVLSRTLGTEAAWLRCRVLAPRPAQPDYTVSPTVRSLTACTMGATTVAVHAEAIRDEYLGESSGVPGQRMRLAHAPITAGDPVVRIESSDLQGWQPWVPVDSFAASTPRDRHVRVEPTTGEIVFGPAVRLPDGTTRQYGAVPSKGAVVRAAHYRTGGGRAGNVARGTISVLRSAVPYVSQVVNREAARGGVDGETVEEAKIRAPITLRAQERAVTVRDYEELARRAAPEVARVVCLPADAEHPGAVRVLVVPQAVPDRGGRLRITQLVPGDELLARITAYLDERRPVGIRLAVGPPYYQGITVVATVHSFAGTDQERLRLAGLDALYAYLDPLTGGPHGTGWPFGRGIHAGDLFAVLQRVPGVEAVDEVLLHPADPLTGTRGEATARLEMDRPALIFSHDHRLRVIEG
ncbi:putative baseplate assembly protein [Frankia sp. AgKG'84/4]|uniref:putative baseplate assembly protein n=1 Tax=Frankia sp. AgKG'84/4 TaxID=573490 RepID=UPI00200DC37C|nr:putative baseplate assembly protein [Frankia sp. AgKG'84/4]MCL9795936.1 putative baseplate assembly protein [Frankia sp. AgKG'84/4]